MTDSLRLQISLDDDGTAELFAEMQSHGYRGQSSAWINPERIAEIAHTLVHAFPLSETLGIEGGYWSGTDPATLIQEHLAISFYPVGNKGAVGCRVRLATPLARDDRPNSQHTMQAELLTSYEELRRFAKALDMLSRGMAQEAILTGDAV